MQLREKIFICAIPYLASGYLWYALAWPVISTGFEKADELSAKRNEQVEVKKKLFDWSRLERDRANLHREIEILRACVPKNPSIDVLLIDLEKIAAACNIDVVKLEPPNQDKLKELAEVDSGPKEVLEQITQALPKKGVAVKPGAKVKEKQKSTQNESGLSKAYFNVELSGGFLNFIDLVSKLERYQRVIGISNIAVQLPEKAGESRGQNPDQLQISFLLTAYYLP